MASGVCGRRKVEEWMLERGRATFASQAPPTRHQPDLPTNQLDLLTTESQSACNLYIYASGNQDNCFFQLPVFGQCFAQ